MRNLKAEVLLNAAEKAPPGVFIEIGCIREEYEVPTDGFSTVHLARFCKEQGYDFWSVDTQRENVAKAYRALGKEGLDVEANVVCQDGREFLEDWNIEPISFLYLDSHRDPRYSLEQYQAAWLKEGAIVVIDDSQPYDDFEYGKATSLIELFTREDINFDVYATEPGFAMTVAWILEGRS